VPSRRFRSLATVAFAALLACLVLAVSGLGSAGAAAPAGPAEEQLIVSRLPEAGTAQPVTLVRLSGTGVAEGAEWTLPTTASGANHPFTLQGNSNAVGALARSADGRYVTLAGYTTAVGGNPEAADPRVVARVDSAGEIDTSTTLGTTFEKEKIRGAVSNDGSSFWVTGNGNGTAPLGGMVYAPDGSSSPTVIVSREAPVSSSNKALNNFRTVQIAGGNLYTGSEKGTAGIYSLAGLPTKATSPTNPIAFSGEVDPISELPLESEPGSGKVDLMYIAQENTGIVKYSLNGTTWTNRGTVTTGSYSGLAGRVTGEGAVRIYALKGYAAANSVVTMTDSAAASAAPVTSAIATVATAPSGTAYRGLAFAPEGPPPAEEEEPAAAPTIELPQAYLEGTLGDPTNPAAAVTVGEEGVEAGELTVKATASSNPSVATVAGVTVSDSGADRTVTVTPAGGTGIAVITLQVTGAEGQTATAELTYGVSPAVGDPATTRYHTMAADGSTAIDVGDGYMLVGDDENNTLRLYRDDVSGPPVKSWNFDAQMGNPEEIDIEASARLGNTIYWTGSMGNSKKGKLKPYRSTLFTTQISGEGADTELSFGGYYTGLRQDLIGWDQEHGNRFGFAAGAAEGRVPKEIGGFNVEGLEFAPGGGPTAYIGFRAPLSPAQTGGKAILVPVTNFAELVTSGRNTTQHAAFGREPITMDLGGLAIREIRRNADGEYLILAGSWAATGPQALYTWDGEAADLPVPAFTKLPAAEGGGEEAGAWEGISSIPDPLASGSDVELLMDDGAVDLYGTGVEAKELPEGLQKSPSAHFTLELPSTPVDQTAPTVSGGASVGSKLTCSPGTWSGEPAPGFTYRWLREGVAIPGATAATYTTVNGDIALPVTCEVTATNSAGHTVAESANSVTVTNTPKCTGGAIVGEGGSATQAAATALWAAGFKDGVCPGGEASVGYQAGSTEVSALTGWGFLGGSGATGKGSAAFLGLDSAPSASQIATAVGGGTHGSAVVVIPVAQTSIAIVANPPAGCTIEEVNNQNLEQALRGNYLRWSNLGTAHGSCAVPLKRVVGPAAVGVDAAMKNYLYATNPNPLLCGPAGNDGKTWAQLETTGTAGLWPESCPSRTLNELVLAGPGVGSVVDTVNATPGSIGFAALPEAEAGGARILALQNSGWKPNSEPIFASPAKGEAANCGGAAYTVPADGRQVAGASGLDVDWSGVFSARPAAGGTLYPLCMLSYAVGLNSYSKAGLTYRAETTAHDYLREYLPFGGQVAVRHRGRYLAPLPSSTNIAQNVLAAARLASGKIGY
jgi:hypothetical protein